MDSNYFYNVYSSNKYPKYSFSEQKYKNNNLIIINYAEVLHTQPGTPLSALQVTFNTLAQPDSKVSGRFINVPDADDILMYESNYAIINNFLTLLLITFIREGNSSPWTNVVANNSSPYPLLVASNFTIPNSGLNVVIDATEVFSKELPYLFIL